MCLFNIEPCEIQAKVNGAFADLIYDWIANLLFVFKIRLLHHLQDKLDTKCSTPNLVMLLSDENVEQLCEYLVSEMV